MAGAVVAQPEAQVGYRTVAETDPANSSIEYDVDVTLSEERSRVHSRVVVTR